MHARTRLLLAATIGVALITALALPRAPDMSVEARARRVCRIRIAVSYPYIHGPFLWTAGGIVEDDWGRPLVIDPTTGSETDPAPLLAREDSRSALARGTRDYTWDPSPDGRWLLGYAFVPRAHARGGGQE
jgi:hypothetical protein